MGAKLEPPHFGHGFATSTREKLALPLFPADTLLERQKFLKKSLA